jgi:hypothetical protein
VKSILEGNLFSVGWNSSRNRTYKKESQEFLGIMLSKAAEYGRVLRHDTLDIERSDGSSLTRPSETKRLAHTSPTIRDMKKIYWNKAKQMTSEK